MKNFVHFFGLPLSILFGTTLAVIFLSLILTLLIHLLGYQQVLAWHLFSAGALLGALETVVLLASLGVSILYIIIGGIIMLSNGFHPNHKKKKVLTQELHGHRLLLRGVAGIILTTLFFFTFSGLAIFVSRPFCPEGVDFSGDCLTN